MAVREEKRLAFLGRDFGNLDRLAAFFTDKQWFITSFGNNLKPAADPGYFLFGSAKEFVCLDVFSRLPIDDSFNGARSDHRAILDDCREVGRHNIFICSRKILR